MTAAAGGTGPPSHSGTSSGRTPASTSVTVSEPSLDSAPAMRRSSSVLPARAGPAIVTREPRPNGVSQATAWRFGSSPGSSKRSVGKPAGSSS